jgi:hypothetical protein
MMPFRKTDSLIDLAHHCGTMTTNLSIAAGAEQALVCRVRVCLYKCVCVKARRDCTKRAIVVKDMGSNSSVEKAGDRTVSA